MYLSTITALSSKRKWQIITLSFMLLFAIVLIVAVLEFTGSGFDTRLNYYRLGEFQPSTPSLNSSGSMLVFDSVRSGNGDIFAIRIDTTNVEALVNSPNVDGHPVFSHDDKSLAFSRQTDGYQHVWLLNLSDRTVTQLTEGRVIDYPVSCSTNGFVFKRCTFSGRFLVPHCELFEIGPLDTSMPTVTRIGEFEAISPDLRLRIEKTGSSTTRAPALCIRSLSDGAARPLSGGWEFSFSGVGDQLLCVTRNKDFSDRVEVISTGEPYRTIAVVDRCYLIGASVCLNGEAVVLRTRGSKEFGPSSIYLYTRVEAANRFEVSKYYELAD